jgi:hypothetical protein
LNKKILIALILVLGVAVVFAAVLVPSIGVITPDVGWNTSAGQCIASSSPMEMASWIPNFSQPMVGWNT